MMKPRYNQIAPLVFNFGVARRYWYARHDLGNLYVGCAIYDASGNLLNVTFGNPLLTVAGTKTNILSRITGQVNNASPGTFTDNSANFTTAGVVVNDWLYIYSGANYKGNWYRVTAVTNATNLVVEIATGADANQPFTTTEASLKYHIVRSYYLKADFGVGVTQSGYIRLW